MSLEDPVIIICAISGALADGEQARAMLGAPRR